MDCQEAQLKLSADLDGELPSAEAESLRLHLSGCPDCVRRRAVLESTRRAYRSVAREVVAPDRSVATRAWATAAAVAAVGVLVLALSWRSSPPRREVVASHPGPGWEGGGELLLVDCGQVGATSCVLVMPCQPGDCAVDFPDSSGGPSLLPH